MNYVKVCGYYWENVLQALKVIKAKQSNIAANPHICEAGTMKYLSFLQEKFKKWIKTSSQYILCQLTNCLVYTVGSFILLQYIF